MIKKKIPGYYNNGRWMPAEEIRKMYPDVKDRERLPLSYEERYEVCPILSLIAIIIAGAVAFGIAGAIIWELHMIGII